MTAKPDRIVCTYIQDWVMAHVWHRIGALWTERDEACWTSTWLKLLCPRPGSDAARREINGSGVRRIHGETENNY